MRTHVTSGFDKSAMPICTPLSRQRTRAPQWGEAHASAESMHGMAGTAVLSRHGNDADHSDPKRYAEKERQHDAANAVQLVEVCLCVHGAIVAMAG